MKKVTPKIETSILEMIAQRINRRKIVKKLRISHTSINNFLIYGSNTEADRQRARENGFVSPHYRKEDWAEEKGFDSFHDYKM